MDKVNQSVDNLYWSLIQEDEDGIDKYLEELSHDEDAAGLLLNVFKEDDDFIHEFHMVVHLLDTLPPDQIYRGVVSKLLALNWRSDHWASYIVNGLLNGVPRKSGEIDYREFLRFVSNNGSHQVKACLLRITNALQGEGKLKTDAAQLANQLLTT